MVKEELGRSARFPFSVGPPWAASLLGSLGGERVVARRGAGRGSTAPLGLRSTPYNSLFKMRPVLLI